MTPLIIIGAIAGGLLLVSLVLRINAIFLFTAFATGALLTRYIGSSAGLALSSFVHGNQADVMGSVLLLWLPIVLAVLFLRRSLPASTFILQLFPIIVTSAAAALVTLSLLTPSFQGSVYNTSVGHMVNNVQDLVIAGSGVTTFLVVLIIGRPRHHDAKHGGKHHKG